MGEVRTRVILVNQGDVVLAEAGVLKEAPRRLDIDAVVDTGAVMTLLPQDVVETLGLPIDGKIAGRLLLTIGDRQMDTDCLVGPPSCEPLVGQLVLERLDLIVDPLRQTVTPRPESPFLPTLKLK